MPPARWREGMFGILTDPGGPEKPECFTIWLWYRPIGLYDTGMKIVKITPTQFREWRANMPVLVDPKGNPLEKLRTITEKEAKVLSELERRAKHMREGQLFIEGEGTPAEKRIEISLLEVNPQTIAMHKSIDGMRVVDGREFFRQKMLSKHGECQMRSVTGRLMGTIRDPKKIRPTVGVPLNTPRPENCECREWAGPDGLPHPGRHHRVCPWDKKAPLEERSIEAGGIVVDRTAPEGTPTFDRKALEPDLPFEIRSTGGAVSPPARAMLGGFSPIPVTPSVAQAVPAVIVEPTKRVVTPENATDEEVPPYDKCICQEWLRPDGSKGGADHHPVCQWKERSERIAKNTPTGKVLVDLETRAVLRQATIEEEEEAKGDKGYCTVAGRPYGVVPAMEVSP